MTTPSSIPAYTQGFGTAFTGAVFLSPNSPSTTSITGPNGPFKLGQIWIDTTTSESYMLVALSPFNGTMNATWSQFSSASGILDTISTNIGVAIPNDGNIDILFENTMTATASGNKIVVVPTSQGYPITQYVVGTVNNAGYQTIQAAVNAANSAGGGIVYIQAGSYTENLTLYTGTALMGVTTTGSVNQVNLTGNHTLATGASPSPVSVARMNLSAAGNLFATGAAIPVGVVISDCTMRATGGYVISIPNLTTTPNVYFIIQNCTVFDGGTMFANIGTTMTILNTDLAINGSAPTQQMGSGSTWTLTNVSNVAPIVVNSGNLIGFDCVFNDTITAAAGTCTIGMNGCYHFTDTDPAFVINATSGLQLYNCQIGSTAPFVIDGTSTGMNFLNGVVFTNDTGINPALTIVNASTSLAGAALLGTTVADVTSLLTMVSTTQGFLPPRMTTAQKNAIATPTEGLVVYDLDLHQLSYYNGTAWTNI